jgi:hypothetical protein
VHDSLCTWWFARTPAVLMDVNCTILQIWHMSETESISRQVLCVPILQSEPAPSHELHSSESHYHRWSAARSDMKLTDISTRRSWSRLCPVVTIPPHIRVLCAGTPGRMRTVRDHERLPLKCGCLPSSGPGLGLAPIAHMRSLPCMGHWMVWPRDCPESETCTSRDTYLL